MDNTSLSENSKMLSFLTALTLFLSAVEFAIPKPMPFLRLGLANLPLVFALFLLPSKLYFALAALKILTQNLLSGTLFSYTILFSVCGTLSSSLIMFILHRLLYRKNLLSVFSLTLAGAGFNCLSQLAVAGFILFKQNVRYLAPFFLLSSLITGTALGIFAQKFLQSSKWFKTCLQNSLIQEGQND